MHAPYVCLGTLAHTSKHTHTNTYNCLQYESFLLFLFLGQLTRREWDV